MRRFSAERHMCSPALPSRVGGEGLGVTPHPAQALQLPAAPSPLLKVPAEQSRDGTTAVCHRGLGCQLGTEAEVLSGVKRWFLSEECHLFPCLLHLSLGMLDGQIPLLISLNSPQVSCFQHRTPCPGCSCPLFASLFFFLRSACREFF